MRKIFALLALVLGVVSCQTEPEGFDATVGGEKEVNITVSLPEATRSNSALGAFGNVDFTEYDIKYFFQVFNADGSVKKDIQEVVTDNMTATFPVRLIPGRTYNFVVWAHLVDKDGNAHYAIKDGSLENIVLNENNTWVAMDETRDAYTGKWNDVFTGAESITITLTRPFAKLRVITTDMAELMDVVPAYGKVTYTTNHRVAFNALEGKAADATEAQEHTYKIANYDENSNISKVLFTDYFFAEDDVVKFDLEVYEDEAMTKLIKANNFNTDIPVKRNTLTTIAGNILTTGDNITVEIDDEFEGANSFVDNVSAAQSALDNVIANTTIYLEPGVDYGTLYLRPVAGGAQTKVVDWIGNNYGFETYSLFENLTIVGAEGATVDAIKIEGGTYYNTDHSQKDTYPVMLSLIELKNVVFDGVTFTGKGGYDPQGHGNAVNLSGNNIKVDGLTFKNCVLNNNENNARLLYKTESTTHVHTYAYNDETYTFTPSLKNITITGCTLNGGYMGLELREAENITITNNEFNVNDRNILLPVNTGCTYSGNITITGNVSNNAQERFVRADGTGDAVVVIANNTLNNYQGADADYIKVTNGNNVTIENNTLISNISTAAQFISALNANGYYVVINDITISGPQAGTLATRANDNKESVIDLNGYTITFENLTASVATIKPGNSVAFVGEGSIEVVACSAPAIINEGAVVDETFNVTDEVISGAGEVEYVVSDVEGMKAFAAAVDNGNDFSGQTVTLTENIDLYELDENGEAKCFNPIGDYRKELAFRGTFDGQGKTIKNLNQNTWALDIGYHYGSGLGLGLFACVENATIKNLKMDHANISGESALCGIVAATAYGDCTFENITVTNSQCADYQYYAGGIVGWASGNHQYINCNLDASTIVGGQWGDFANSNGGVIGGAGGSATILMKDCNVACRIDAVNDVVSTYHYYAYRCCGMLIGNTNKKQDIDGTTYAAAPQLTCENVTVTYGDWMNYHYCEFGDGTYAYVRAEAGVSVSGYVNIRYGHPTDANGNTVVDHNHAHNDGEDHHICLPFDQLLGGGPNGDGRNPVYGLASFPGVAVVYPAEYTCPVCGQQHNVAE